MDLIIMFQFSPPHRGHQGSYRLMDLIIMFQFSPPHRGHLEGFAAMDTERRVSILAPAQGASWHSPAFSYCSQGFNSRPRTGGIRKNIQFFLLYLCRISKILFNNIDHILTMIHSTSIQSYIKQYFLREPPELTQMIPVRANSPNRIRT